jgi:hypothetical protein
MTKYQPKYKWQETRPGEGKQDLVGYDGKEIVARIQVDRTTSGKENQ